MLSIINNNRATALFTIVVIVIHVHYIVIDIVLPPCGQYWYSSCRYSNIRSLQCMKAESSPEGIMRDSVVAEADLMTLLSGLVVCFSESPDISLCRARRAARSLMAFGLEFSGPSATPERGDPRSLPLPAVNTTQTIRTRV